MALHILEQIKKYGKLALVVLIIFVLGFVSAFFWLREDNSELKSVSEGLTSGNFGDNTSDASTEIKKESKWSFDSLFSLGKGCESDVKELNEKKESFNKELTALNEDLEEKKKDIANSESEIAILNEYIALIDKQVAESSCSE